METAASPQHGPEHPDGFNRIPKGSVRILILEDNPFDSELMEYELKDNGIAFESRQVASERPYRQALGEFCPDLILSDYDLPQFNGAQALKAAREICPDVPFILVTGAVGEDRAIEILTGGATDYVLKNRLSRLIPAVRRALQESDEHRKRRQAEFERDAIFKELEKRVRERTESLQAEIERRKETEERLREARNRVRMKLESILNPAEDIGQLELSDIMDQAIVQSLLEEFYKFVHVPIVIEDLSGNILVSVGWQDICAKFHRVHPETCRHCLESDTRLSSGIRPGEFKLYRCKNNMWDMATPIVVGDRHVGNFYTGQFILENEPRDHEQFRDQARRYGFDEEAYLAAYEAVPVLSREFADNVMTFLMKLADMISKLSFSNIKLARTLTKYDAIMKKLDQSRAELSRAQAISKTGSWRMDIRTREVYWSEETYRIFGIQAGTPLTYEQFLARVHPDDRARVDQTWKNAEVQGDYDTEFRIKVDSEIKWLRARAEFDRDADGRIVYGMGTTQDITDLKRVEEALRENEAQFRAIFDLTGIGMCQAEPATGVLVRVNDSLAKMLGYAREELVGKTFIEITHPEDRESSWSNYLRLLRGETQRYDIEKRYVRKDGATIWCTVIVVLVRNERGDPLRTIVAIHDITDRKRTEAILRGKEERFRLAQEAGKVGVFDWVLDKDECFLSEGLAKIYGFPLGYKPSGREWIHFVHPDDRQSALAKVQQAFKEHREELHDEYRIITKEGRPIWLSNHSRIYYDESGNPVRMIGSSVDVTERKQVEIALREAEEKLRLAVESTELGTFDMDPQTYKIDWSVNSKLQFGLPPDGKVDYGTFLGGIHPDDRERINRLLERLFRGESGGYYSTEFRTIGIQDKKLRWIASWGRVFFDENGRPVRFIGVSADITELKQTELALQKRTAELENLNRELESFSYSVSHDLRAPLRAITGYSRMILDRHGASMRQDLREKFDLIVQNAHRMEELIGDLLRLSRLGRGKLAMSRVDMKQLALEAWQEINQLPGKNIDFRVRDLPAVHGDRNLLKQVLANLLSNAVKFTATRDDPRIELGGYRQDHESVYYVKDNGIGFDMQYSSRLFGAFQRLHGAEYKGTGIGLAIVQRIVHRHGGKVWAEGEPEKGAAFYFSLPCPKPL